MTVSAADERAIKAAAKVMILAGVIGEALRQVTDQKVNVAIPLMGTFIDPTVVTRSPAFGARRIP